MKPLRSLAQAPVQCAIAQTTASASEPAVAECENSTSRRRHTARQWENVKDVILRTYAVKTLEETMRHVKQECNFEAGVRQYKKKLSEWGVGKHFKDREMRFVRDKKDIRQQMGVPTTFLIRGTRIDPSRIQSFHTRTQSETNQSPNHSMEVTPDGIMYFTPAITALSPETLGQVAHVSSPMFKWSNLALETHNILREDIVAMKLLTYCNTVRKIEMLKVDNNRTEPKKRRAQRRKMHVQTASDDRVEWLDRQRQRRQLSKYDSDSELDGIRKRHVHKCGSFFVAATGFFRQDDILRSLLYEGNNFAVDIFCTLSRELSQTTHEHQDKYTQDELPHTPEYAIILGSNVTRTENLSLLIKAICSNQMIRRLMEVSDSNRLYWGGPWRRMTGDRVSHLTQLTSMLYGVYPAQGPDVENITVLVSFSAGESNQLPSLLRIVIVEDCSVRTRSCRVCQNLAMTIDCIGLNGGVKFQATGSSIRSGVIFHNFAEMEDKYSVEKTEFFTKWTRLAGLKTGMLPMKHLRQCHCDGAVHQGGFRPHFVDMDKELKARKEVWDPMPEDVGDEGIYDCYPAEVLSNEVVFIENHLTESESDEEHWDILGQEARNTEAFDLFPSEDDGAYECVSKPVFLKIRHS